MAYVYYNGPEQYRGPGPEDSDHVVGPPDLLPSPQRVDGLYFRQDTDVDPEALARVLTDGDGTVRDFQQWADTGWKTMHGTYDTVARFGQKMEEERGEYERAARTFRRTRQESDRQEVVSELGDVLLCATILSSNGSAAIDAGLKYHLYQYTMGVQWYDRDGAPIEPTWRPRAAALATKYGSITVADIDDLIRGGFVPLPSPIMNVYDPEDNEDGPTLADWSMSLASYSAALRSQAERQYAWGGTMDVEGFRYTTLQTGFREAAFGIGIIAARLYLEAAFVAQRELGTDLRGVIRQNVAKITGRIANRLIDKTDGPRT